MATGAILTARNMPAERRCAAALDGTHHLQLPEAHMTTIGVTPAKSVIAENVRDLQSKTGHGPALLRRRSLLAALLALAARLAQVVERTDDVRDHAGGDPRIARRRLQLRMSEQRLDCSDVGTAVKQVRRERMAERAQVDGLPDAGRGGRLMEDARGRRWSQRRPRETSAFPQRWRRAG